MSERIFNTFELPCEPIERARISILQMAQWLACAHDEDQAAFFNEFDVQLRRICELNSSSATIQIAFIRKYLTKDAEYTFLDLGTPDDA